ncbi:MAG: hypothetical protein FJ034_09225, partial [Chloroflexi bacterium]|nr:hypothetical protein [Chloroflexota bacterium]
TTEARRSGAARLHERGTGEANVAVHSKGSWGDPARGRSAPVRISGSWTYPRVAHAVMEQNTTVARWDAVRERFELWTSTQAPHFVVHELAHVFGLRLDQIVCREVAVGGGFGSKSKISEHEALAAALARKAGAPVRIALSREEEFAATKPRHGFRVGLEVAADGDGRLRAIDAVMDVDNGAYNHFGPSVMWVGIKTLGTLYMPDGVSWDARLVDTALPPGGQFRGYGGPQAAFAIESAMDEIAARTGLDPIDVLLRNSNVSHSTTLCGARLDEVRLPDCLRAVREAIDWDRKRKERRPYRGLGVAAGMHGSGSFAFPDANKSGAAVELRPDGSVQVRFGGADAGTGQRTILAQIAAEELGVALERVEVLSIDSERTPLDMGAWSSRGTHMMGSAVRLAARGLVERLSARGLRPADHARLDSAESHEAQFVDERMEFVGSGPTPNFSSSYTFAAHAVEVEVDPDTGAVRVLDYVAAHDIGRAINPTLVEGQIIGGVAMGLGAALGEELLYEAGRTVNPSYLNYALPRAADLPRIRPILIEGGESAGPYGAKSTGELSIVPPAPAVA